MLPVDPSSQTPPHPLDGEVSLVSLGSRRLFFLLIALAAIASAWQLHLDPRALIPGEGGRELTSKFFAAAFSPALNYEAEFVPQGTAPLLQKALMAAWTTIKIAAAAIGLSIILGSLLGFAGSTAWWRRDLNRKSRGSLLRMAQKWIAPGIYVVARLIGTISRSIHELIWAILFLALFGLTPLVAVLALTIPYTGTLAKIFSEMIDEAPDDAANALKNLGARPTQVFVVGLLPRALPDLISYALYRFECGLRSSAIMGFVGIPTLGLYIRLSHENAYYHEVWTYLYVLLALVIAFDLWGGALRKKLRGETGSHCRRSL